MGTNKGLPEADRRRPDGSGFWSRCYAHLILVAGMVFLLAPVFLILFSSTHSTATLQKDGLQWFFGGHLVDNYSQILSLKSGYFDQVTPLAMLKNSLIVGFCVAILTTVLSLCTAYAIVFIKMPLANWVLWLVLITLLFPLEARFVNTFEVTVALNLINSYAGIVLPVLALALGTFFFRQYFLTLPGQLIEAAILDGAGAIKFFFDIIVPLSLTRAGAIFVIAFMVGWNQYLWPLMISTDDTLYTLVRGIRLIGQESGPGMALIVITIIPPFVLLLVFQRWFYRSLCDMETY